ncbi:MAG: hypothetical protein U9P50_02770 [Patescibacteria group bacterium]|nr:hypothetical protein [Patescibacteria group bacterium]
MEGEEKEESGEEPLDKNDVNVFSLNSVDEEKIKLGSIGLESFFWRGWTIR